MNAQQIIAQAIIDRGYRDGHTPHQFAAHHFAKLVEEVGELNEAVVHQAHVRTEVYMAAKMCRIEFDRWDWTRGYVVDIELAKAELADVVVTALSMAQAIADITGEPFDVVQAAVDKATADVKRGVR